MAPPSAALNVWVSPPRSVAVGGETISCPFCGSLVPVELVPPKQPASANDSTAIKPVQVAFTACTPVLLFVLASRSNAWAFTTPLAFICFSCARSFFFERSDIREGKRYVVETLLACGTVSVHWPGFRGDST